MGWVLDLFDGFNLVPECVAKLSDLESQFAILERENVNLKLEIDKLRSEVETKEREKQAFQQENQDLRKTREFPSHITNLLAKPKEALLVTLGAFGGMPPRSLADRPVEKHHENVQHIKELEADGYLQISEPTPQKKRQVTLTEKGKEYLDEHFLR